MIRSSILICLLAIVAVPAAALEVLTVSESAVDCDHPAIAESPRWSTIVAWQDADLDVWSVVLPPPPVPAGDREYFVPMNHGPGHSVRVANTWFGFLVVWIDGSRIAYQYLDGDEYYGTVNYFETYLDLDDATLDVYGVVVAGWSVAWVVFEAPYYDGSPTVYFVRLTKGGVPEGPLPIAQNATFPPLPQVTGRTVARTQPLARVYYLREDNSLAYRGEVAFDTWHDEVVVPFDVYGSRFDADGNPLGGQSVLSLALQPLCPCNAIYATLEDAQGTWLEPERLTVDYDDFDWPKSPCVRVDAQGHTHAFWSQLASDAEMYPTLRTLEYWVFDGAQWTDGGEILEGEETPGLGDDVALDLTTTDQAVFAWTVKDTLDGVPQPRQILAGRPDAGTPAPDSSPRRPLTLVAWPNPFNPAVSLSGDRPGDAAVTLTVHDLAGRLVARPRVTLMAGGGFTARWDGLGRDGRAMPAGVYLARVAGGGEVVTRRLTLAR